MIINHNIMALSAVNISGITDKMLHKSIQPLATGLKINNAADDASGLAISEKMRSQIAGYDMAVRNAQDGLSMLRTAEGALTNTNDMLHRMRELSVQASNDVLTAEDRTHIQEEIDELKEKINRISDYTHFNTKKLLDGTSGTLWSTDDINLKIKVRGSLISVDDEGKFKGTQADYRIEAKAKAGSTQTQKSNIMTVGEIKFSLIEEAESEESEDLYDISERMLTLNEIEQFYTSEGAFMLEEPQNLKIIQGDGKSTSITLYGGDTIHDVSKKINDAIALNLGQGFYTDNANKFSTITDGSNAKIYDDYGNLTGYEVKAALTVRSAVQGQDGEIYFAGNENLLQALGFNTIQKSQNGEYEVSIFNVHSGEAVVSDMKVTGNELKGIVNANVDVEFSPMAGLVASWDENNEKYLLKENGIYTANIHMSDNGITFQIGTNEAEIFFVRFSNVSSDALGVDRVNVMTPELASRSITILDEAIDSVVKQRSQIVSHENAIEHSAANLASSGLNLSASKSRITDADYAKSAMRYIEFQILSKTQQAVLTQANQQPEAVFSLMDNS